MAHTCFQYYIVLILHSKAVEIKLFTGVLSSRAFLKAALKTEDSSEALSYAGLLAELIKKSKKRITCSHYYMLFVAFFLQECLQ